MLTYSLTYAPAAAHGRKIPLPLPLPLPLSLTQANYLDITEKYVGIIAGYGNTLGTVASWAGPQIVAGLLQVATADR